MFDPSEKVQKLEGIFSEFPAKTPTAGEPDGPLFGNGDIGVAAGGRGDALTFWIGKNDFWSASRSHDTECHSGMRGFATLQICSDCLKDASFSARQKIGTADVEIELSTEESHLCVNAYAPYQQSLVLVQIRSKKGQIPLQIKLEPLKDEAAASSEKTEGNVIRITKEYAGKMMEWDTKAAAACKIMGWEQTKGNLAEGDEILLAISVYTNHDTPDYTEKSDKAACGITKVLLKQYRTEHLAWWHDFWQTSGIIIPSEPDVENFWYASHYLMACCCKAGKFSPSIFGNWITTNAPNWAGDYHLNYNYQAPWWGVFSSNKISLADPYDQPLMDYIPQARENAWKDLKCRGIYAKVGIGPKGLETSRFFNKDGTENHVAPYWGQKSNSAYAAVNMIMRFYSTWDKDYAQTYALPYLCEVADFWEDYLKFENGRYVIYNDCIHENVYAAKGALDWVTENTPDYSDDFNPILTLGLLRILFKGLLDISEYLGTKQERREKWAHILAHLSDFPIQEREGKTVFRYTERGLDWWNDNSLGIQHIFPCGTIGLSSDEKLLQIARNTIEVMHRWSDYNAFPTFFTAAARVGYCPEIILKKLKEQFLNHSFPNFFIHYGGGGIECCSAVPSCINEMLFQSHEGILRFFPAWDKKKDAAFYQLRGYDAFVVSAEIKDGVVGDIDLFSEKGRPCSVLCPWQSPMVVTENESAVKCETKNVRDGIVYMFETKPHTFYKIKPEREK